MPAYNGKPGYRTADEAHAEAVRQLDYYRALESAGTMEIVSGPGDIVANPPATQAIILMEGADSIRNDADARKFFDAGVRIVGLTWKEGTRYARGNSVLGPLTRDGISLVKTLD